jgi:hypothetical protein
MDKKIKVVALAPRDGWAFIEDNGDLFLLRPPYTVSSKIQCTKNELEEAVLKHGFHSVDYPFKNYSEAIRFIKDEHVKSNKERGAAAPTMEELKELLDYASEDVLLGFLGKAEKELIPEGKIEAAESLALDLMKLDKLIENKKLLDYALNIIYKCADLRKKRKEWEIKFQEKWLNEKFGNIVRKYSEERIIERIRSTQQKGVLFPI